MTRVNVMVMVVVMMMTMMKVVVAMRKFSSHFITQRAHMPKIFISPNTPN